MGDLASGVGSLLGGTGSGSSMLSMGLDVLGTGLSVAGGLKGASEDAAAYRHRAMLAREGADQTLIAGNIAEGNKKAETTRRVQEQDVAYAANGLERGSGTPGRVMAATQMAGDIDAAMMHYDAMREAFGLDMEADLYEKAAKNAKKKGKYDALGSLLSGASSLAGKWSTFKQSGAIGGGGASGGSLPGSGKITDPWGGVGA